MIAKLLSLTAVLVGMFLILDNHKASVSVINSLGNVYTNSVKALQGN